MPDLVSGEICIAGKGLARGYWGNKEDTQGFCALRGVRRTYTALATLVAFTDGNIEILGRTDFQIKVNGFRIEIGEVEAAINAIDSVVKQSLCMPVGKKGAQQLVAFIVCVEADAANVESRSTSP